jgi:hypothetical protein
MTVLNIPIFGVLNILAEKDSEVGLTAKIAINLIAD